jgi:hypothetical protein
MPFALAPVVVAVAAAVTPLPKYGTVTQVFYDRVHTNQPIRTCTLQPKYYSESGQPVGVREICTPY